LRRNHSLKIATLEWIGTYEPSTALGVFLRACFQPHARLIAVRITAKSPLARVFGIQLAEQSADSFQDAYRRLEEDIHDLARMLRAADHLQSCGEEDMESSARLLVEKAAEMAEKLDQKYQESFTPAA
jgi:hypothetical protein